MADAPHGDVPSAIDANDARVSEEVCSLANELVPLFYNELRSMARRMRGYAKSDATVQTTALVNETYLKLRTAKGWVDDAHFLNAAALAMRHVLVSNARARTASKRGSGALHVTLSAAESVTISGDEMIVRLHEALDVLSNEAPRLAQIVVFRYFGGFDDEAIARALSLSVRTVQRDWVVARAWLHRELGGIPARDPASSE